MRTMIAVLALVAVAAWSSESAACTGCDGYTHRCGYIQAPLGYGWCVTTQSGCSAGGECDGGGGEIERERGRGRSWLDRVFDLLGVGEAEAGSPVTTVEELEQIKAECNQTPGCSWMHNGQSGGYGKTWGTLKVLHR